MKKLKIVDNVDLKELDIDFNLDTEIIDGDYEAGYRGDIEHSRGGVFISETTKEIYGIDCSNLVLLYELIISNLVEVVEDE